MNTIVLSKLFISRLKVHTHLIESINKTDKTSEDLHLILEKIRKLKFFREFLENTFKGGDIELLLEFSNSIKHDFFNQGDVIIRQNDLSNNKMYVVLTGMVYVMKSDVYDYVNESDSNLPTPRQDSATFSSKVLPKIKTRRFNVNSKNLFKDMKDFEEYLTRKYGRKIRELKSGEELYYIM